MVSAALIDGTSSWRVPSGFARSMARPRLTCAGVTSTGLPFSSCPKPLFISGMTPMALTRAKPMMWVKLTLPPRLRARWLLMTMRLSMRSFAGTARTDVAVGTCSELSMFVTTRALAPRMGVCSTLPSGPDSFGACASLGFGAAAVAGGSVRAGVGVVSLAAGSAAGAAGAGAPVGAGASEVVGAALAAGLGWLDAGWLGAGWLGAGWLGAGGGATAGPVVAGLVDRAEGAPFGEPFAELLAGAAWAEPRPGPKAASPGS